MKHKGLHGALWIAVLLCLICCIVYLIAESASAATVWTERQEWAHKIAESARAQGLDEDNPIIVECQRLWQEEEAAKSDPLPVGIPCEEVDGEKVNERYASIEISDDELRELAALIYLEARGEPADGQQAVAEVVLNRVLSDEFPNTVHDVIYDTKYGVQFTPYKRVASTTPTEAQYEAIHNALYGDLILDEDVLYFSRGAYNSKVFIKIGGHVFCRG